MVLRSALFILAVLTITSIGTVSANPFDSRLHRFSVTVMAQGLERPWGMAFLPGGDLLVTERTGAVRRISDGRVSAPISGVPEVVVRGQGGLLDIALHPDFASNGWVYLSHAAGGLLSIGTDLTRVRYDGERFVDATTLFRMSPRSSAGQHFGSRVRFLPDGTLVMTLGDRGDRDRAQDPADHAGSTVRLRDDGTIPDDNPWRASAGAFPELFTIGNRNVQGLAVHPATGLAWAHEHGPQGGDEVNVLRPGVNYGWPVITYGVNYGIGTSIGEGTAKAGMAQPLHYWVPSIAPSGMAFYTGNHFTRWRNNLFVGSLKFGLLVRLELDGERVVAEERLLNGAYGRIRDVRNGPDGNLYLLTDASDGRVLRIEPAD